MNLKSWNVDKTWTLFLDRDGVINERFVGDYVKCVEEFCFLPGVPEAIAKLSKIFGRIIVVTNQQGISKGIYTHDDLREVHAFMTEAVETAGGKIDAVYYAYQRAEENSPMRKPGTGMAMQAKMDFPEIDFSKAIMDGDTVSDMQFAHAAGMKAVFVLDKDELPENIRVDGVVNSLMELADLLQ